MLPPIHFLYLIKALRQGETRTDKLVSLVHKRIINKHGKTTIQAALTGIIKTADQGMLFMGLEEAELYERQIRQCEEKLIQL